MTSCGIPEMHRAPFLRQQVTGEMADTLRDALERAGLDRPSFAELSAILFTCAPRSVQDS